MTKVLVTGGNGVLGHELAPKLRSAGYSVRIMSRQPPPTDLLGEVEWAQADLEAGQGLREAVTGTNVIIHAASNPQYHTHEIDVDGTQRLLEQAQAAHVSHVIYVSIVGIERIPYPYYRFKVAAEAVMRKATVPFTILRTTQFYDLVDFLCRLLARYPLIAAYPAGFLGQPIAAADVATRLCECVAAGPAGLLPDMGGPEVLSARELPQTWLVAQGQHRILFPLWLPGKAPQGFRNGYHTAPDHRNGKLTWTEWLRLKNGQPSQYADRFAAQGT